jgi:hypothetical protein
MSGLFLFGAVTYAVVGVAAALWMLRELRRRGVEVDWLLLRLRFFRYLEEYKRTTLREAGRVGMPYYVYLVSMLLALACAVVGLVLVAL